MDPEHGRQKRKPADEVPLQPVYKKSRTDENYQEEQTGSVSEDTYKASLQAYLSYLPAHAQSHLDQQLDWDHRGVDTDLDEIADHMSDWEKLSSPLELTTIEIDDIKEENKSYLRRRKALRTWQDHKGLWATYRNLLEVFVRARHSKCAKALCGVLRKRCDCQDCQKRVRFDSASSLPSQRASSSSSYGDDVERDHPNQGPSRHDPPSLTRDAYDVVRDHPSNQDPYSTNGRTSSASESGGRAAKLDINAALDIIKDVLKWRNLGIHLGVKPSKLDEIATFPVEEQKSRLIVAWFDCDEAPSLDKLRRALRKPSVAEIPTAESLMDDMRRPSLAGMSGSSFDMSVTKDSPFESDDTELVDIPFTQANVLEAIIKVSNPHNLGLRLGVQTHELKEIERRPVEHQDQLLVSAFFRTVPMENQNWKWVNKAIKAVEIEDWTGSRSASTGESYDDSVEVVKRNLAKIKGSFATLVTKVTTSLMTKNIDMNVFRLYIITLFPPGNIVSDASNVAEVFEVISRHQLWDFSSYSPVEEISKKFGADDPELSGWIVTYKAELAAYKAMTKIADFIKACNDDEDIADSEQSIDIALYNKEYCRKLSFKLKARVTEKSLEYIDQFWRSIADDCYLPSLSVLLNTIFIKKTIIKKGCVEVTWYVLTRAAVQIQAKILQSKEFLKKLEVTSVIRDSEILYSEEGLEKLEKDGANILSLSKPYNDLSTWLQDKCEEQSIGAAKEGDLSLVKNSLEIGVDPNAREKDKYGWTASHWASEKGHSEVIDCLMEYGAKVDTKDKDDWTGLILSSRRGYLEIVKKLLDKGANVNQLTNVKWSSLLWTAQEGHTEVARLLLERGADPTIPDKNGFTPLTQASQDGRLGVVKLLVEQNPDIDLDVKTNMGWSAIMVAAKNGHKEIVQYLAEELDIHYAKEDEVTALHIASFKGHNSIVRYMCMTAKMDVNAQDTDGVTPLMFAAKQGDLQVVRTLVENGRADVNISENDSGWTAPFFSLEGIENRDLEVLDYLLRSGRVEISHKDKNEHTIVDIARTIKPKALDVLAKYNKAETEKMISQSQSKPLVNMKNYQRLFEAMNNKVAAQPRKTVAVM